MLYTRHGQSEAFGEVKLIFPALGPILLLGKSSFKSQLIQIWTKLYIFLLNKHQRDKISVLQKLEQILKYEN